MTEELCRAFAGELFGSAGLLPKSVRLAAGPRNGIGGILRT
jgi:hypothetical protein